MRKNERFRMAMERTGLAREIEADFKGWGAFHIDNADIIANVTATTDECALLAVTWLNETTFRFYSEPNTNNSENDDNWDVGPLQLNRGIIKANIENKFLNAADINLAAALLSTREAFIGDPLQNIYLGWRLLKRIGRGTIIGPSETILYNKLSLEEWDALDEDKRNERRAVAYTGPNARPLRFRSWAKYSQQFRTFFDLYNE